MPKQLVVERDSNESDFAVGIGLDGFDLELWPRIREGNGTVYF